MQIKNKIIACVVLIFFTLNLNLAAEEFNISATEITIDKVKDIVVGKGSVEVTDVTVSEIRDVEVTVNFTITLTEEELAETEFESEEDIYDAF